MKKILAFLFSMLLIFSLTACTPGTEEIVETAFYEKEVLSHLTDDLGHNERLTGMTDDIAVILNEDAYDKTLLTAEHAGLFNDNENSVVYVKNAVEEMYPASLTKCMTALLVLENCPDLTELVTVGDEYNYGLSEGASLAGLQPGGSYTIRDLLTALILPSGNDAANVLAKRVSGSVDAFVDLMNDRAAELGMLNTHFMNPHGLHDKNHYTSIYDLYLLVHECIKYDVFCEVGGTERAEITCHNADGTVLMQSYQSTNSYLRKYTIPPYDLKVIATKTGYTTAAKRNLILVTQDKKGTRYISIITQAEDYDTLYLEMNALLSAIEQ